MTATLSVNDKAYSAELGKIIETSIGGDRMPHLMLGSVLFSFGGLEQAMAIVLGESFTHNWIKAILGVAEVDTWEQLKGTMLYVLRESDEWSAPIVGLMNPITKKTCFIHEVAERSGIKRD